MNSILLAASGALACALGVAAGTGLDAALESVTVKRLEALASQRRLVSRTVTNGVAVCTYVQGGRTWTTTNALKSVVGYARPPRYSKLKLYAALSKAGKWDALKAWLAEQEVDGINAWEAFTLAQDLTADNDLFAAWLEKAKAALGVDDATAAAILKAAEE